MCQSEQRVCVCVYFRRVCVWDRVEDCFVFFIVYSYRDTQLTTLCASRHSDTQLTTCGRRDNGLCREGRVIERRCAPRNLRMQPKTLHRSMQCNTLHSTTRHLTSYPRAHTTWHSTTWHASRKHHHPCYPLLAMYRAHTTWHGTTWQGSRRQHQACCALHPMYLTHTHTHLTS